MTTNWTLPDTFRQAAAASWQPWGLRPLSPRQLDIVRMISRGHTIDAVAGALYVSRETVARDLRIAEQVTGARGRAHLVAILLSCGAIADCATPGEPRGDHRAGARQTRARAATRSLQSTAPLEHVPLRLRVRQLDWFRRLRHDGRLELAPPYRPGTAWSTDQQRIFLRAILHGVPAAVVVNRRAKQASYVVVDGGPCLEAMLTWGDDELDLPASWFEPGWIVRTHQTPDGPYCSRAELSALGSRTVSARSIVCVTEYQVATLADEARLFAHLNRGRPA